MPKVMYVDANDEIADLISRVRDTGDADEVALVIPEHARVLQVPLNLRLLKQFAQSSGRAVAVVSPDARTQHLATAAGFTTYASLPAYERGIELVRPHPGGEDEEVAVAGVAAAAAGAAAGAGATAGRSATRRSLQQPSPAYRATPAAAGVPPPAGVMRVGPDQHRPYYFAAIAAGVVGILLLFLVVPSSTVNITLAADPITVASTIVGSADSSQAGRPDSIVTTVVTDDQSASFKAIPTGTQTVPAHPASGTVSIISQLPQKSQIPFLKGHEFDTADNPPIKFYVTDPVTVCVPGPSFPCNGDGSDGAPDVIPVTDGTAEARGNVPAGAIKVWPQNPCPDSAHTCSATDLTVANTAPMSGGADEKKLVIASPTDVNTMTGQGNQLQSQLTNKLLGNMAAKAGSLQPALDPTQSGRTISCTLAPQLPKAGDQYAPTDITVACHGKEAVYNTGEALNIVKADLQAKVPQGDQLASNCHIPAPIVTLATDDGRVILSASGDCFAQPVIDVEALRSQFTGKGAATVSTVTRTRVGAQVLDVTVDQRPFSLPWLSLFSSRIDVVVKVVPKKSATG